MTAGRQSPLRRARADALADFLERRTPLAVDSATLLVLAGRGLDRAGVDAALDDLHEAGHVRFMTIGGYLHVALTGGSA